MRRGSGSELRAYGRALFWHNTLVFLPRGGLLKIMALTIRSSYMSFAQLTQRLVRAGRPLPQDRTYIPEDVLERQRVAAGRLVNMIEGFERARREGVIAEALSHSSVPAIESEQTGQKALPAPEGGGDVAEDDPNAGASSPASDSSKNGLTFPFE